jgi:protein-S-isoprenylcysteine O-methyltransferase Ste14
MFKIGDFSKLGQVTVKKQQVITTGVYGFVRHPLYLGTLLMILGASLLMGSI